MSAKRTEKKRTENKRTEKKARRGRGDALRAFRLLRRFAAGQRVAFGGAFVWLAFEAATSVVEPLPLKFLIDFLQKGQPVEIVNRTLHLNLQLRLPSPAATVMVLAGSMIVLTAVNSLTDSMAEIALARGGRSVGYNLRVALYSHLQNLSLAFHVRRSTGDVLTRITSDVTQVEEFILKSVSDLVGSVMLLAGTITFLAFTSWQVTVMALVLVPLLAVVSDAFARRIKATSKELRAREGDLATAAQEMLSSIGVVQIYGRSEEGLRRFAAQSAATMTSVLRTARLEATFSFTVSVLESLIVALVVWVGAVKIGQPQVSVGTLVLLLTLIANMFKPTRRIIKEWSTFGKVFASVERINDLLDREAAVRDLPGARPAPPLSGAVEFRDVSFAYQAAPGDPSGMADRLALDGVSFTVAPGEVVALVGHSGAGKSTIAQLLPRLYDPHAGAVLLDGHDIRSFTLESLRAQISMVLQETVLFSGTVAENIRYGRAGATDEEVVEAAKRANAHDFITAMPNGYQTVLGERAATLSGGQRQRLAIARAFIRNTPLLVLDEPTTGLDAESSDLVFSALDTLLHGKTAMIVSHDLNLIRGADRVLVISAGRILEDGSPADLLASGGLYAELYARQFGAVAPELVEPGARRRRGAHSLVSDLAPAARPAIGPRVIPAVRLDKPDRLDLPGERDRRAASRLEEVRATRGAADGGAGEDATAGWDSAGPAQTPAEAKRAFESALMEIVPLPASNATFRQMTGQHAVMAPEQRGPLEELDPAGGAELRRALPGLADAMEPSVMVRHLQAMLAHGHRVERCSAGKVLIDPGDGATLRYQLTVRDSSSGAVQECVVTGRLFVDPAAADPWRRERVDPLAEGAGDRAELRPFARPVSTVEAPRLVLYAFPIDPYLPGLLVATDAERFVPVLAGVLKPAVEGLQLHGCRPSVVQYARRGRCVLRYEVLWRLGTNQRRLTQLVYGKVYAAEPGAAVAPAVTALRAYVRTLPGQARFVVPKVEGYLPAEHVMLFEAVPGSPVLPHLVREAVSGGTSPEPRRPSLEQALATTARIAATLHTSGLQQGPLRTLPGELEAVRAEIAEAEPLAPILATTLRRRLDAVEASLAPEAGRSAASPRFSHGDFTPSQVLFDGPLCGLIDLDTAGMAEPALDLGHFLAHLDLATRKGEVAAGVPGSRYRSFAPALLQGYAAHSDTGVDPDRVAAFRTLSLARIAVRSWRQLKPARVRLALHVLDTPGSGAVLPVRQARATHSGEIR